MNKQKAVIKSREYMKQGFVVVTVCDQTGMKVGSASCEKNCDLFHSIDRERQVVMCYCPNEELFKGGVHK